MKKMKISIPKLKRLSKSLALQINLAIFLIVTTVFFVIGSFDYVKHSKELKQELHISLNQAVERLSASLTSPFFNLYDQGINDVLVSEMKSKTMTAISIFDLDGMETDFFYSKDQNNNIVPVRGKSLRNDELSASKDIKYSDEVLGRVEAVMTTRFIREKLLNSLLKEIIQLFVVECIIIGLILFLFKSRVFNTLSTLTKASSEMASGNMEQELEIDRKDELGVLSQSFVQMRDAIKSQIEELSEHRDHLEELVSKRTSELSTANDNLKQEQAFLKNVIDSLSHPFYVIDANDYTIEMANTAASRETVEELSTCYKLTHKTDQPCSGTDDICPLKEIKETKQPVIVEHVHYDQNNNPTTVEVHAHPIFDDKGDVVQVIEYAIDITERKKAEKELETANKRVVETARQAGMAEIATGVLHNVGNILNSVNVTTETIKSAVHDSKVDGVGKILPLLEENSVDIKTYMKSDEQGIKIANYFNSLAKHIVTEKEKLSESLEDLTGHIKHITEIVALQQSYSKAGGLTEAVSIVDIINDAVNINSAGLTRHQIDMKYEFHEIDPILVDRHKVLQIIINLINNAKQAVAATDKNEHQIKVAANKTDDGFVEIAVSDNGVGISPDNMKNIFNFGFTTKDKGHGYGLHSGANAAKEMGGSLSVHSDGLDMGSTFTLKLPFKKADVSKGVS